MATKVNRCGKCKREYVIAFCPYCVSESDPPPAAVKPPSAAPDPAPVVVEKVTGRVEAVKKRAPGRPVNPDGRREPVTISVPERLLVQIDKRRGRKQTRSAWFLELARAALAPKQPQ